MTDLKISVIIPIYNVQNFIKRCACSLFEQTMCDGVEFIFVNDATPDKSMEILYATIKEYPERKGFSDEYYKNLNRTPFAEIFQPKRSHQNEKKSGYSELLRIYFGNLMYFIK